MGKYVKIFIASTGKINNLPGMYGPIDVPFTIDATTALAIVMEGHTVYAETTQDGIIRLHGQTLLDFMDNYGITDEDIRKRIEEMLALSKQYEQLETVKDVAEKIIALQGTPVAGYESLELIGKAIKAILGSIGTITNFDEATLAIEAVSKKIDDYYKKIDDSDTIDSFKDIENLFSEIREDLLIFKRATNTKLMHISNGAYMSCFKDVESKLAALFNGSYIRDIKDVEALLETLHKQNQDSKLAEGTEFEISAEEIHVFLDLLQERDTAAFTKIKDVAIFASRNRVSIDKLASMIDAILDSNTIKSFKDVEATINSMHNQNTDTKLAEGTENEVSAKTITTFIKDTNASLIEQKEINEVFEAIINGIRNSSKLRTFYDVELALSNVHEQGTDTMLGKNTEFEITAEEIVISFKYIFERNLSILDSISSLQEEIKSVHKQNSDTALAEGTESEVTVDDILVMKDKIENALEAGAVILVESTIQDALSKYISQIPDNQTIVVEGNKLKAKTLDGLVSTISELNASTGIKSNIQTQLDGLKVDYTAKINALTGSGGFNGYYETNADRLADTEMGDGIYIVSTDESHAGNSTLWRYKIDSTVIPTTTEWIYLGKFNIEVRDFTTNPLNLSSEVTGTLPKYRLDATFLDEIVEIKEGMHDPNTDSFLDYGLETQVSAVEIRNGLDKIKFLTGINAASLIDDVTPDIVKTYSSIKIENLLSEFVKATDVYNKTEQSEMFLAKADYEPHSNMTVLQKIGVDDSGNLTFEGEDVFKNKDLISVDGVYHGETDSLSLIFSLMEFLLNKSVVYPTGINIYITNLSDGSKLPIQCIVNDETVIIDEELGVLETRGWRYSPTYSDMKVYANGNYKIAVSVSAYKLQDFIDLINVKYHSPNADKALAEGTEDHITAHEIKSKLKVLDNIDGNFIHARNTDDALAAGTANEITAAEIKDKLQYAKGIQQSAAIAITETPMTFDVTIAPNNKALIQVFKLISDPAVTDNKISVISTFNATEEVDFDGDTDKFVFDGSVRARNSYSDSVTTIDYASGKLGMFDYINKDDMSLGLISASLNFETVFTKPRTVDGTGADFMRYDSTNSDIGFIGTFDLIDDESAYNNSYRQSTVIGDKIQFNFTGDKIRLGAIVNNTNTSGDCIKLTIDDKVFYYNEYYPVTRNAATVALVVGLNPLIEHTLTIENMSSGKLTLDFVDLSLGCKINPYSETVNKTGGILFKRGVSYFKYVAGVMELVSESAPTETNFLESDTVELPLDEIILDFSIYVYAQDYTMEELGRVYKYKLPNYFIYNNKNKPFGTNVANVDGLFPDITVTDDAEMRFVFSGDGINWYSYKLSTLYDIDITDYTDIASNGNTLSELSSIPSSILNEFISTGIRFGYMFISNNGEVILNEMGVQVDLLGDMEHVTHLVGIKLSYGKAVITATDMVGDTLIVNTL